MIGVRFTRGHGNYNRGEVAHFPEEVAKRLIDGGAALPIDGAAAEAVQPDAAAESAPTTAKPGRKAEKAKAVAALPGQGGGDTVTGGQGDGADTTAGGQTDGSDTLAGGQG
jgi:hypothetical protein